MGAAIASTMFHRSKETKFLLVDAIISGTLGVIFIFTGQHTLINEWYGILSIMLMMGMLCVFTSSGSWNITPAVFLLSVIYLRDQSWNVLSRQLLF
ncbi:hypothetical protein Plhal710r2_c018g0079861 [Plasmopara halstedii]